MTRNIDDLIRDITLPSRGCSDFQRQRRLIQNTMDAARYLSPQLQRRRFLASSGLLDKIWSKVFLTALIAAVYRNNYIFRD